MPDPRKLPNRFGFDRSPERAEKLRRESEHANYVIDAIQRVVPMDTPFHLRRELLEGCKPESGASDK